MTAPFTCEQMPFPAGALFCLILAIGCIVFAIFVILRLRRERLAKIESKNPTLQHLWAIAFGILSILMIFVSINTFSLQNRLQNAYSSGDYEIFQGTLTDITVDDKGTDFLKNKTYAITLTLDNKHQFTCYWLETDQILQLQKGTVLTIGCATQIGFTTTENDLTIYQSPDHRGNVVSIQIDKPAPEKDN